MEMIKLCLLIGGETEKDQIIELKKKPNILIGTPGRVCSLAQRKQLNLKNIQVFVIDECDKMIGVLGKLENLI